jgi:hypothetical protein
MLIPNKSTVRVFGVLLIVADQHTGKDRLSLTPNHRSATFLPNVTLLHIIAFALLSEQ